MPSLIVAKLNDAIKRALLDLEKHDIHSAEYAVTLDRIAKLEKMKEAEMPSRQISPDTLALCVTNLAGIFMIIRHEHMNALASKALAQLMRTR